MRNKFLTRCRKCGGSTSLKYARGHEGQCKSCVTGKPVSRGPSRSERIVEHGYDAYAREEGHYDLPDYA
jgi:hypothetical protein